MANFPSSIDDTGWPLHPDTRPKALTDALCVLERLLLPVSLRVQLQ